MKFYQYWILVIASLLVFITVFNIIKTLLQISKNTSGKTFKKSKELDSSVRNLLISICLLSIASLVYIVLVFYETR